MQKLFQYCHGEFIISIEKNFYKGQSDFTNHSFWQGVAYDYILFNNRPDSKWDQCKFSDHKTVETFGAKLAQIINITAWQYSIEKKGHANNGK